MITRPRAQVPERIRASLGALCIGIALASAGTPSAATAAGNGSARDREAVRRTVGIYLQAITRSNGTQACAQLTPAARAAKLRYMARLFPETAGNTCAQAIILYQGAYGRAALDPKVTRVRIKGRKATCRALGKHTASLVKVGRRWYISKYDDGGGG